MEQLSAGWNRREDGILEYTILQSLFVVILILPHFCNH